jgi:hypothetical protein
LVHIGPDRGDPTPSPNGVSSTNAGLGGQSVSTHSSGGAGDLGSDDGASDGPGAPVIVESAPVQPPGFGPGPVQPGLPRPVPLPVVPGPVPTPVPPVVPPPGVGRGPVTPGPGPGAPSPGGGGKPVPGVRGPGGPVGGGNPPWANRPTPGPLSAQTAAKLPASSMVAPVRPGQPAPTFAAVGNPTTGGAAGTGGGAGRGGGAKASTAHEERVRAQRVAALRAEEARRRDSIGRTRFVPGSASHRAYLSVQAEKARQAAGGYGGRPAAVPDAHGRIPPRIVRNPDGSLKGVYEPDDNFFDRPWSGGAGSRESAARQQGPVHYAPVHRSWPVDENTGWSRDPNNGHLVSPVTGARYNPWTGWAWDPRDHHWHHGPTRTTWDPAARNYCMPGQQPTTTPPPWDTHPHPPDWTPPAGTEHYYAPPPYPPAPRARP